MISVFSKLGLIGLVLLNCLLGLLPSSASATNYYVDNVAGNDANAGTSISLPWQTIARVNSKMSQFVAGDIVSFKRGGTWTDMLTISKSGVSGNPITFNAYGTGNKPIIRNPSTESGRKRAIYLTASYTVIENFMIKDTVDRGIDVKGSHNVIRNNEITNLGEGVVVDGTYNLVTQNYMHDMFCVGAYGATGISFNNTDNEASYNSLEKCRAPSSYFGYDGGAFEFYGNTSRSYVHHNWSYHNQGFMEIGAPGTSNPTVSDVRVEYNIALDTGRFTGFHITGNEAVTLNNFRVQNNTIIETANSPITVKDSSLVFDAVGPSGQYIFRNNILYLDGWNRVASSWTTFNHDHNLYYLLNGTKMNITPGSTDIVSTNPKFINLAAADIHLASDSPARDRGVALGYGGLSDFDGNPIPFGPAPDMGAYEFTGAGSPLSAYAGGSPTTGQAPLTVNFTGSAAGGTTPYSYSWNFGDGGSSTTQNPSHSYSTAGTYTATLTVRDNASATASSTVNISLVASTPLSANVVAAPTSGQAPLAVNFSGSASGGITPYSYRWVFGDGGTSTSQNPSHTYSIAGNYTATLTVTDSASSTNSKSVSITVTAATSPVVVTASADPTSGLAPLAVAFSGTATGGTAPYTYSWTFGDGGTANTQNPAHVYSAVGSYNATLSVSDSASRSGSKSVTISVNSAAGASLTLTAETGSPAPGQGGTTDPSPGNHTYSVGSNVQVNSVPNTNYRFSKWSGAIDSAALFNSTTTLTMDTSKSLLGTFCTLCADVNGDLKITPADAQKVFDMYLGRIANPTWCELENADVNGDGTKLVPKITPADAHYVFKYYIKRGIIPGDCSGNMRTLTLATQGAGFSDVTLMIGQAIYTSGQDIQIPVIVDSPTDIQAFGFDLVFPAGLLTYVRTERTDLTAGYDQVDANLLSDGTLRIGGYKSQPGAGRSTGELVTLVFRVNGDASDLSAISVAATYDDIQNASITNGMVNPGNGLKTRETVAPRRSPGKRIS